MFDAIISLFRFVLVNSLNFSTNVSIFLLFTSIQESLSTNSGVAQLLYQKTGTHNRRADAVHKPKLSLVRLINHLAFFMISIIHVGSRHVKIMPSHAIDLRYNSSGQLHITSNGNFSLLNNLIIKSDSLTKFTNLPTYT
jgi:hypothetical protein